MVQDGDGSFWAMDRLVEDGQEKLGLEDDEGVTHERIWWGGP